LINFVVGKITTSGVFYVGLPQYFYLLTTTTTVLLMLPFYGQYTLQPAFAGSHSYVLKDFVGAQFHCLHAFANGSLCISITMLRVSPFPYCLYLHIDTCLL